ncbi:MAG: class I SAM-dependent methyltransferase [Anaerolineae bacterium]|nr:class I SAM-dependent methyltransferase [Anaerolineae bacterium]
MDLSENSIQYARAHDPVSTYICDDYLHLDAVARFDAACLIYGDLCVLSDPDRDAVLRNVHRALRPGGYFAFDVTTPRHHDRLRGQVRWTVVPSDGFWKPGPHLVLFQTFDYPEHDTGLEQYIVIEQPGAVSEYRIWTHYYTAEAITATVEARGFRVEALYSDLTGAPYHPDSEWIGVVARKK